MLQVGRYFRQGVSPATVAFGLSEWRARCTVPTSVTRLVCHTALYSQANPRPRAFLNVLLNRKSLSGQPGDKTENATERACPDRLSTKLRYVESGCQSDTQAWPAVLLYNIRRKGSNKKATPLSLGVARLARRPASWRRDVRQGQGRRFVKKTQAQTFFAGGLDNSARIVYYSTAARQHTHLHP